MVGASVSVLLATLLPPIPNTLLREVGVGSASGVLDESIIHVSVYVHSTVWALLYDCLRETNNDSDCLE